MLHFIILQTCDIAQVLMVSKKKATKSFSAMESEDIELTMFTITNLNLLKIGQHVEMTITLKRKISMELLTTFLPTILLLLITFTSIFFDKNLFGDALAVNLTIMLVMTTIFTSKIQELPSTSDTKMIDIWLIGCLLVPFTEVVLRTMMEVLGNCDQCRVLEEKEGNSNKERKAAWKDAISMSGATSTGASGFMSETLVSFTF